MYVIFFLGRRTTSRRNRRTIRRTSPQQASISAVPHGANQAAAEQPNHSQRALPAQQKETGRAKVLQFTRAQEVPRSRVGTARGLRRNLYIQGNQVRKPCNISEQVKMCDLRVCKKNVRPGRFRSLFYVITENG